jgi:hypothetical protein
MLIAAELLLSEQVHKRAELLAVLDRVGVGGWGGGSWAQGLQGWVRDDFQKQTLGIHCWKSQQYFTFTLRSSLCQ